MNSTTRLLQAIAMDLVPNPPEINSRDAIPPHQRNDDEISRDSNPDITHDILSQSNSTVLIAVLVPVLSIFILALLAVTARKTWSYYKKVPRQQTGASNLDPELVNEEKEPLRKENKAKTRFSAMRIVQESDKKSKTNRTDETNDVTHDVRDVTVPSVKIAGMERKDEEGADCAPSEMSQRPSTLKLLAASVAFQAATVPALKRLPYTPEPDCALCVLPVQVEPTESIDGEVQDKVAPLTQQHSRFKMKPKGGLLERRGSNVALTISLRPGEKALASAKSPRPLAYLQKASSPMIAEELHAKSCDNPRLQQEFWEIPMNHPSEKNFDVAGHGTKDRYRILPNEHSRVKLPLIPGDDPLSSYINANYIRDCTDLASPNPTSPDNTTTSPVTRSDAAFIATQGPMTNTITDFWRMVWQEKSASVIMLTKLKERKEKCCLYLPLEVGDRSTHDDISLTVTAMKKYEHFVVRSMELSCGDERRQIRHFWYTTWMDHETPEKTRGLLELVQEVSIWNKTSHGPMVVHCSAGIGRTGCYIAVTVGCQQLMKKGKVDILRLVSQMRLDRGGMIQTWEQYQFVHQALSRYGRILAGENVTTPSTTGSVRSPPVFNIKMNSGDQLRPPTPKHRRSLSETNLPSPKEPKTVHKTAPSQTPNNNASKPATPSEKSRSSKWKTKLRLPKSESTSTPPPTPKSADQLLSPQLNLVKSNSSPAIRSPFGRMCLQVKDMNAVPSPLATSTFEWPQRDSPQGEIISLKDPPQKKISKSADSETAVSNFSNVSQPASATSKSNSEEKQVPVLNGSSPNSKFSFELPDVDNNKSEETNRLPEDGFSNHNKKKATSPRKDATNKSNTPCTALDSSCFVFPAPSNGR